MTNCVCGRICNGCDVAVVHAECVHTEYKSQIVCVAVCTTVVMLLWCAHLYPHLYLPSYVSSVLGTIFVRGKGSGMKLTTVVCLLLMLIMCLVAPTPFCKPTRHGVVLNVETTSVM